jgi:hypothetical protein
MDHSALNGLRLTSRLNRCERCTISAQSLFSGAGAVSGVVFVNLS